MAKNDKEVWIVALTAASVYALYKVAGLRVAAGFFESDPWLITAYEILQAVVTALVVGYVLHRVIKH